MSDKSRLSWNEGVNPEKEDREAFLKLSYSKRWNYLMALIMSNYPNKKPTNYKKIIEWT